MRQQKKYIHIIVIYMININHHVHSLKYIFHTLNIHYTYIHHAEHFNAVTAEFNVQRASEKESTQETRAMCTIVCFRGKNELRI